MAANDSKINANSIASPDGSGGGIIAVVGSNVALHHSEDGGRDGRGRRKVGDHQEPAIQLRGQRRPGRELLRLILGSGQRNQTVNDN
ncbi:hypothetical protein [Actinopolymorpha sp. B9G3]|uniref:hypothetical protein n=1 Tax=Actinopolymorpha sp. B9G3 TaxID=3158970 RepID=UPI0032D92CA0